MENNNPILEELKKISPLVAAVGRQLPYAAPEGYFDNLAFQLMIRIAVEEKSGADPVLQISKHNVYQLPQDYFDNLADTVMNRVKAQETDNPKEELELLSPLLGQAGKKNPFCSPDDYFNEFPDNIVAGVKAIEFVNEELENLSPTMLNLKNRQVYQVQDDYFETSPAIILEKAKQLQTGKLFTIGFGRKIIRYAAAAVISGLIVFAGYRYSGKAGPTIKNAQVPELAKITDQEMENFLSNNIVALANLETDTVNTIIAEDTGADDSKGLLANISDEELQQYADLHLETPITN